MIPNEERQLSLFRQHRPLVLFLFIVLLLCVVPCAALPFRERLVVYLAFVGVLVVAELVPGMIHPHHSAPDGRPAEVVHGQVGAALVLVLEPAEAFRLAGLLVSRQLQPHGLAELGEDRDYVAFRHLVW